MIIKLNGLELGNGSNNIFLTPNIEGLEIPPIRTSQDVYTGRDGAYVSSQFFGGREIVIRGIVRGLSCDESYALRCEIINALPIRQLLPLYVIVSSEATYYTDVYLLDFKMDYETANYAEFQITVLSPNPYFSRVNEDDPDEGWVTQIIEKVVGGGYVTPYVLPVIWRPGSSPTVIDNPSGIPVYPQIILEGKWTNPIITNETTGQFIQVNITTTAGDTLIIDSDNRTITLNGGSVLPFMQAGSTWFPLLQGENLITLNSSSSSDGTEGTIRYRFAYTGVFAGLC